ncbi:Cholinesterase [Arthrobotrys entomopaga]|nr:Cholinesterase [Arthrobotrys entomopaga]
MKMKVTKSLLSFVLLAVEGSARIIEVGLDAGKVQGSVCPNLTSTQFLGIPYAIPPVGNLRWEAPLKYNGTFQGGALNATKPPATCYQFTANNTAALPAPGPYSEDCLFVNVWVPQNASNTTANLPVKVWIYGGANFEGSINTPDYNGCQLAEDGAITVSIAYRLGALGYLALESAGIAGNFGIQDILLGLQWVQDNVGKFGGDKDKVLLFGQSAGAWDSWIISSLPQAPSLIRAAALHSGGGVDFYTNSSAQTAGALFARQANCSTTDAACLRKKTPTQLIKAFLSPGGPSLNGFTIVNPAIEPFIDGKVIPVQPSEVGTRVPTVFSSTSDEGRLFLAISSQNPENLTDSEFDDFLKTEFGPLYAQIDAQYPDSQFQSDPNPRFARASQILTDYAFKCPAYRGLLKAAEKGIPAWTYIFAHQPSCSLVAGLTPEILDLLGPTHGYDVPFFFGHTSGLPVPNGTCNDTPLEKNTSSILVDGWTALANTGNLSTTAFNWPTFTNASYQGLYIGPNSTEITSLAANYSNCEFWDQINAAILQAANTNATNVTKEIPTSATITATSIPTSTKPSAGFKAVQAVGHLSYIFAVLAGYIIMEIM